MTETKLQHFFENERKATFKSWIFSPRKPCNAEKMAEAGFIFTGSSKEPDSVKCIFCQKSLDGWEENDDPWTEHLKHAPYCDFAKKQMRQDQYTLLETMYLMEYYMKQLLSRKHATIEKEGCKKYRQLRKML